MLLSFLLVLLVLICIALTTVILLQRSEGGAFGMGGNPSGLLTARGAGDLLTRTTAILAAAFFILCMLLTVLSGRSHTGESVVDRLKVDALNPDALNHAIRPQAPITTTTTSTTTTTLPATTGANTGAPVARGTPGRPAPASFEAPRAEVHTSPASNPTSLPPAAAADTGARAPVSQMLGYQSAPSASPTIAGKATPAPGAAPPSAAPARPSAGNTGGR